MLTAWIGIAYSIFIVTMKMEAVENLRNARRTWRFGILPFLSSFCVMSGLFLVFFPDLSFDNSSSETDMERVRTMVCVTTSISTFPVISENLLELNLITSELGQIALSATMLSEVAHWVFITLSTVINNKDVKHALAFSFFYLAFIFLCVFIIRPAMLMIARSTPPGKPVKEAYVVLVQIGVVVIGFLSDILGMSFIQGPFLVGLVMPHGPPLATTIAERTEVIISHFLLPLYFCYVGVSIDVFAIHSWQKVLKVQLIIIAGFMTKLIVCILISLSYKIRLKHGLVLGLMLNFKGIIDIIVFTRMRVLQV